MKAMNARNAGLEVNLAVPYPGGKDPECERDLDLDRLIWELRAMATWLFKTEPTAYSFSDLLAEPDRSTGWDGVRNYQARNLLRDQIQVGDDVLFYHSNGDPPAIVGVAEVIEAGHPDPTAFDPTSDHHDPESVPEAPTWFQVRIRGRQAIDPPLTLPALRAIPELSSMELLRKGSRLSVQPVSPRERKVILGLAGLGPAARTVKKRKS